jgi:hypothetical protein
MNPTVPQDIAHLRRRPLAELQTCGLLWLINRVALHPRGFSLALVPDDTGQISGWCLVGDGSRPLRFDDTADQAMFVRAETTLTHPSAADPPTTTEQIPTGAQAAVHALSSPEPTAQGRQIQDLYLMEQAGVRAPLYLGPYTAFELISALQLVLRHPQIQGGLRTRITTLARTLADTWFAGSLHNLLERGFDTADDTADPPGAPPSGDPDG